MYECEVILPETSPIRGFVGKPAPRKSLAKQSAAFDTCLLLRKHSLLDGHFVSSYQRRLPAMRNAKLSIKSQKTTEYPMIVKPAFWKKGLGITPCSLYATVIIFCPQESLKREHRSMILLSREKLPQFPEFPLYLEDNIETNIRTISLIKVLTILPDELELITTFTLRIFQDLYNKTFERNDEIMPYWLVPASGDIGKFRDDIELLDVIDWDTIRFVALNDKLDRSSISSEESVGRFVYDQWDGKYRYFLTSINTSVCPSDPPPPFLPRRRYMKNIMEYGLSLYRKGRITFLAACDWSQDVFNAEIIPLRRNLLDKISDSEKEMEKRVVLCLETQVISAVSNAIL